MNLLKWLGNNILFIFTSFLLAFIPLYPKLPIIDINHVWVYVRIEDFIISFVIVLWFFLILLKKITIKTPLTMPIMIFWIIGAISTLHGILLIFPTVSNVYSNVAFLSYLRRIEYLSLFFIAYSSIKDKRFIYWIIGVLSLTFLAVVLYGLGQKYLEFPAFLTMNEEFAKGVPIRLSALSRIPSTFGGHYDLAAYLVLMIPILSSLIFGFKNIFIKASLLVLVFLGFGVLFLTVSRVSFLVLLISLVLMLILQRKKWIIISLCLLSLVSLSFSSSLMDRFGNTVKEVNVLVDGKTGEAIGNVKEINSSFFRDKTVKGQFVKNDGTLGDVNQVIPPTMIPSSAVLVVESNNPTGENLPQGTGYINLALSPVLRTTGQYFYQKSDDKNKSESKEVSMIFGNFVVKKALAYDLSFTTRFQGEWPHAIAAFKRNILLGSGYSSVSLAVDNNYLRILGEVGILGFLSFFSLFLIPLIYIKKGFTSIDSSVVKSLILGFIAGVFGLMLNAVLIDVFEASKIAFTLWLLMGVVLGLLSLYQGEIDLYKEFKKLLASTYAVVIYLLSFTWIAYSSINNYFFIGDDFTWFRWVSNCGNNSVLQKCSSLISTMLNYFINSNGFFYRPGTKIYFFLMYSGFWLNQTSYHIVSIALHFIVAVLIFLISRKIFKEYLLSIITAFFFLILSGYSEAVFWISSTGFLFNAVFILLSLQFYIIWREKKKNIYFVISLISIALSLLFHELGVVAPLLIILYALVIEENLSIRTLFKKHNYLMFFSPIPLYLILRFFANSHWFNGDYSYNLLRLPYNFIGNIIGYLSLTFLGPASLPFYEKLRNFSKGNLIFAIFASLIIIYFFLLFYKRVIRNMIKEERKIIIFGFLFFIISLLPFLGLGNITSRYSYLSSFGLMILFAFFLKKAYISFSSNGKSFAIAGITMIVGMFCLIQLIQLQKVDRDWYDAGEKSKRFFVSFNSIYQDSWAKEPMKFYFVNPPIRQGDAWIFPVGMEDALWFIFRNKNIGVYKYAAMDEALNAVNKPLSEKVFVFDNDGNVSDVTGKKELIVVPAKK